MSSTKTPATTREERAAYVRIRDLIRTLPEGWTRRGIQRVNDYSSPGVFGELIENPTMRFYAEIRTGNSVMTATLSYRQGSPLREEDVAAVRDAFLSDRTVATTMLMPGLASFQISL